MKIWWEPEQLRARLAELGWHLQIDATDTAFVYGHGPRPHDPADR